MEPSSKKQELRKRQTGMKASVENWNWNHAVIEIPSYFLYVPIMWNEIV
jgi:hypothetical protein